MGNFFSENWFPLNLIIIFIITAIVIIVWGATTHWWKKNGGGGPSIQPTPAGPGANLPSYLGSGVKLTDAASVYVYWPNNDPPVENTDTDFAPCKTISKSVRGGGWLTSLTGHGSGDSHGYNWIALPNSYPKISTPPDQFTLNPKKSVTLPDLTFYCPKTTGFGTYKGKPGWALLMSSSDTLSWGYPGTSPPAAAAQYTTPNGQILHYGVNIYLKNNIYIDDMNWVPEYNCSYDAGWENCICTIQAGESPYMQVNNCVILFPTVTTWTCLNNGTSIARTPDYYYSDPTNPDKLRELQHASLTPTCSIPTNFSKFIRNSKKIPIPPDGGFSGSATVYLYWQDSITDNSGLLGWWKAYNPRDGVSDYPSPRVLTSKTTSITKMGNSYWEFVVNQTGVCAFSALYTPKNSGKPDKIWRYLSGKEAPVLTFSEKNITDPFDDDGLAWQIYKPCPQSAGAYNYGDKLYIYNTDWSFYFHWTFKSGSPAYKDYISIGSGEDWTPPTNNAFILLPIFDTYTQLIDETYVTRTPDYYYNNLTPDKLDELQNYAHASLPPPPHSPTPLPPQPHSPTPLPPQPHSPTPLPPQPSGKDHKLSGGAIAGIVIGSIIFIVIIIALIIRKRREKTV